MSAGKGSQPRPYGITLDEYGKRYSAINWTEKENNEMKMNSAVQRSARKITEDLIASDLFDIVEWEDQDTKPANPFYIESVIAECLVRIHDEEDSE